MTTLLQENLTITRNTSLTFPLIFFISNLGTLAVIWFGGYQVIGGQLSVGQLVAFNSYLTFLLMPVFILGSTLTSITQSAASARRVFEVIDAPVEVKDSPDAIQLPPVRGQVQFDNVSFRYAGNDTPTLSNVSFTAQPGQTVAILGRTGSGKSTIINLIPRFYDVTDGRVLIDGHDVRDVTLTSLRQQLGLVQQDTYLFSGSVSDNIRYGRLDAEVEAAAKAVSVHDFIMALPQGYKTKLGESGPGLSQGQRQLIAFACTVLADARILVLDEATSSIDTQTEALIQTALKKLLKGRTAFVIAHRLSTIRDADRVLVLSKGRVIEQGTHDELLAQGGHYADLYKRQFP